jgi:CRISPR-associated protein Cmr1
MKTPPSIIRRSDADLKLTRETREYTLITPLFGGGAEPQQADAVTVVRASEVRGHLRFWWRAIRGGAFGPGAQGLQAMKAREGEIWGAPANDARPEAGKAQAKLPTVQLALTVTERGHAYHCDIKGQSVHVGAPKSPYGYAAFPLYQTDKSSVVVEGVKFSLHLTYATAHAEEVAAALWGWETFGGIGGRTRRGFGAVSCTNVAGARPPSPAELENWIIAQATRFRPKVPKVAWPDNVPHPIYGQTRRIQRDFDTPLAAWEALLTALRTFRQYRLDKKTGAFSAYGYSVWPEAREIRRLVKLPAKARGKPASGKFPRAVFGLPIIFQFKDEPIDQVTLKPSGHDRLASPLILKPLQCDNGKSVALAAVLKTPALPPGSHLELDGHEVDATLSPDAAAAIPPLNKSQDVLGAFLAWLSKA